MSERSRRGQSVDVGLAAFYVVCIAVLAFILLPLLTILFHSVGGSLSGRSLGSLTLAHYAGALATNLDPLLLSLQVALLTTVVATLVGVPAGYTLVRYDFAFVDLLRELTVLPMAIPGIVVGIGIVRVWGVPRFGVDLAGSTALIACAHVLFTVPFIVQTTMSTLESIDYRRLEESARALGAGWVETFLYVVVPNIYRGVVAGAIMVFALSMGEFNITFFIYATGNATLPIALFGGFRTASVGQASALASLFVGIVVLSLVVFQMVSDQRIHETGGNA
ncbi:ABC transporter permease [Haloplanus halophilus]|uniref:ABC transporter permease n=1 Tax=Haloplanus halophilus TaxID=2949993 RepID=UPI00203BD7BD|nr:ABC transporter permease subunit [Haloplanus sp. GDY1]